MADEVRTITIMMPRPGKTDEVIKKLNAFNAFVEANEPGTLQYELFRQVNGNVETLVYIEVYIYFLVFYRACSSCPCFCSGVTCPTCQHIFWTKRKGTNLSRCSFKNQAAREVHGTNDAHSELLRKAAEEDLLASFPDVKELKSVGGFGRRG